MPISLACAVDLTFDKFPGFIDDREIHHGYGDNVIESSVPTFGFRYGVTEGWAPNVTVLYSENTRFYANSFGDLRNVIYTPSSVSLGKPAGKLVVTLRADQGYKARLHRFDLAAYYLDTQVPPFPEVVTINSVRITDENGVVIGGHLYSGQEIRAREAGVRARTTFEFNPPVEGRVLNIEVDTRNLQGPYPNPSEDHVGMDNIRFSQVANEDASPFRVFFVAPDGNDGNDGSEQSPFRTIERARQAVRTVNNGMTGDIFVCLRGGTHELSAPVTLDSADSGKNGFRVIYCSYPGEKAIVSGGRRITGWTGPDAAGRWQAPNTIGIPYTRQLWVENERRPRAAGQPSQSLTWRSDLSGYNGPAAMSGWRNLQDIEFVFTSPNWLKWGEPRICVQSIDSSGAIRLKQPGWRNMLDADVAGGSAGWTCRDADMGPGIRESDRPTLIENAWELLDVPGEWYLDRAAAKFFYIPKAGENPASMQIVAPVLEWLVSVNGTPANPVRNVEFKGIQFSHSTWLVPQGIYGFAEVQANYCNRSLGEGLANLWNHGTGSGPYGSWTKTPGSIRLSHAHDLRFESCTFTHLGAAGLDFSHGCQFNEVVGCVFTDISGTACHIGEVNKPGDFRDPSSYDPRELVVGNQVRNSHLYDIATEYRGGHGIFVGYAQETRIAHNQLNDTPYGPVSVGWGWNWHNDVRWNISRNNKVQNNRIFDHVKALFDSGAVYVLGRQGRVVTGNLAGTDSRVYVADGLVISGNAMYDQKDLYLTVYYDGGTSFCTAYNNACWNNQAAYSDFGGNGDPFNESGQFDFRGNYYMTQGYVGGGVTPSWFSGPPAPVRFWNNVEIDGPSEVPASLLDNAGVQAGYKFVVTPPANTVLPLTFSPAGSGEFELSFPATLHWEYAILSTDNLNGTPFVEVARVAPSAGLGKWRDDGSQTPSHPSTAKQRYYAVKPIKP